MKVNIILFGQLTDLLGTAKLSVENVSNTDDLIDQLQQSYPALKQAVYMIAVEKTIIQANTGLETDMTIALLPPYAGG